MSTFDFIKLFMDSVSNVRTVLAVQVLNLALLVKLINKRRIGDFFRGPLYELELPVLHVYFLEITFVFFWENILFVDRTGVLNRSNNRQVTGEMLCILYLMV